MISSLEIQVRQAKSSWEKKEEVLKAQWTKAQQEVKQSEEKLKKADDAFRKQIAEKEKKSTGNYCSVAKRSSFGDGSSKSENSRS